MRSYRTQLSRILDLGFAQLRGEQPGRFDVVEVDGDERGQRGDGARGVFLLDRHRSDLILGAVLAAGKGHELRGALERLHRLVNLAVLAEGAAKRHLHREAARVLDGQRLQLVGGRAEEIRVRRRHERLAHGAELTLHGFVESGLQLIEIRVQRGLERRVRVEPLAVNPHQLAQPGLTIGRDQMFDQQRRLVIRERDRLGVLERRVELAELDGFAAVQHAGERHVHFAPPLGTRPLLLVDRYALGEPSRDALVRHLECDDVRQLVPERRLPLDSPGGRARRSSSRRG
jgi:hypothetical protein